MKRKKYVTAAALIIGILGISGLSVLATSGVKEISVKDLSDVSYNNKIYTYALEKQYETSNPEEKIAFEDKVNGLKLAEVQYETLETILQKKTMEESKDYKDLLVKDESKIEDTITLNGYTYQLENITWSEEPNIEHVSYTQDYGYAASEPKPDSTYEYTYTSPVFKTENTVTLPFVRLEKGEESWVDGFTATVTFHNLEGEYFRLGNHEFKYNPDKLSFTESDYTELVKMLGYDTSKYRLDSAEWSGKAYKKKGVMYRDALASGQQYAASYKAVYEDDIENGKIYTAHATYSCEVDVPAEEATPTYVMKATAYYEKSDVWTNIITFVTEHRAVSAVAFGGTFIFIILIGVLLNSRQKKKALDSRQTRDEEVL